LALSKDRKGDVLNQYEEWVKQSQAVILVEYTGITMKEFDAIRAKVREAGGEFHVVKNTLARKTFEANGMNVPAGLLEKSTAAAFAFKDVAATAKALADATKAIDKVKVKGAFLEKEALSADKAKALSTLPTLPAVRSQLLGLLQAPAGKLVRTIAEPARSMASVFRAYSETAAPAA
jgi:large subunit ribosomal protein L10